MLACDVSSRAPVPDASNRRRCQSLIRRPCAPLLLAWRGIINESHALIDDAAMSCLCHVDVPGRLGSNRVIDLHQSQRKSSWAFEERFSEAKDLSSSLFPRIVKLTMSVQQISQPFALHKAVICVCPFNCWGVVAVEATTQVELGPASSWRHPWSLSKLHTPF